MALRDPSDWPDSRCAHRTALASPAGRGSFTFDWPLPEARVKVPLVRKERVRPARKASRR
jgi:hypothetical protein